MVRLRAEVEAARAALHGRLDLAEAADTASRSALVRAHVARARALEVDERSAIELDTLEAEDALPEAAQRRITLIQENVLKAVTPRVELVTALNFSYSVFKTRPALRAYFEAAHRALKPGGLLVIDAFGGTEAVISPLAVGGFGFGAVLTSPIAQRLIDANKDMPTKAFLPLGIGYLLLSLIGASFFRNPPPGYAVPGFAPATTGRVVGSGREYTEREALRTPQWYLLTALLTLNVTAGIALISQAAASATDIAGYSKAGAAALVGALAIFNGGGRIVWAVVSDHTGRMPAFAAMLGLQGICLLLIPHAGNPVLFFVLAAVIYLCYGGAFGTMPATAGDYFGVRHAGAIYGLMILGWSLGGVIGPLIVSALIGDGRNYTLGYTVIAGIALASIVLTVVTRLPRHGARDHEALEGDGGPAPTGELVTSGPRTTRL